MYYITSFTHPTSSLKVSDEEFNEITARDGIIPAPYLARNKWIQVASVATFSQKEWEHYLRQSYELVKSKLPKKLQLEIEAMAGVAGPPKKKAAVKKGTTARKKASSKKPRAAKAVKKKPAAKKKAVTRKKK